MQMLNAERIKGINYIVILKNGTWNGFARAKDAEKFKKERMAAGDFQALYFWARDDFIFKTPGYYKD